MRFYADRPGRFVRQFLGDLLTVVWVIAAAAVPAAVGVALWRVGNRITSLAGQTGTAAGQLQSSADTVKGVPFVGADVAAPLRTLSTTLTSIGMQLGGDTRTVHRAAVAYAISAAVLGIGVPLLAWALTRGRWITSVRRLRGALSEDDLEGLAHAAASASSLRVLRRLPPGTLRAWTAGDPADRRQVAYLRLQRLGLSPPRIRPDAGS